MVWDRFTDEDRVVTGELSNSRTSCLRQQGLGLTFHRGTYQPPEARPLQASAALPPLPPCLSAMQASLCRALPSSPLLAPSHLAPPHSPVPGRVRLDEDLESRASSWGPGPNSASSGPPSAGPRLATHLRQTAGRASCLCLLG